MLSEMPSVDITRSLYPFLFAALTNCFSFLDFLTAATSASRISKSSFSSGGVSLPSMISSSPLLSAITLNFKAYSCQPSFVLLNLYTLMLFQIIVFLTHIAICHVIFTLKVYLYLDKLLDSQFVLPNQFLKFSIELILSFVGCTTRAFSLFNQTFINMLKNLYSRLG